MMPLLCQGHCNAVLMIPLLLLIVYFRRRLIVAYKLIFIFLDDGTPAVTFLL